MQRHEDRLFTHVAVSGFMLSVVGSRLEDTSRVVFCGNLLSAVLSVCCDREYGQVNVRTDGSITLRRTTSSRACSLLRTSWRRTTRSRSPESGHVKVHYVSGSLLRGRQVRHCCGRSLSGFSQGDLASWLLQNRANGVSVDEVMDNFCWSVRSNGSTSKLLMCRRLRFWLIFGTPAAARYTDYCRPCWPRTGPIFDVAEVNTDSDGTSANSETSSNESEG